MDTTAKMLRLAEIETNLALLTELLNSADMLIAERNQLRKELKDRGFI